MKLKDFAARLGEATRQMIAEAVGPLAAQQGALQARLEAIPAPRDGRDGAPGADGKDGAPGKDGRDALQLEDFQIALGEDGRTLTLALVRGEERVERQVRIPAMLYRGVWREGKHEAGDVVTWGGSAWHCNMDTEDKPGQSPAWRLMVKEGRPGKDASGAPTARGDGVVRFK